MKVRVTFTVDVDDVQRKALASGKRLATRDEVRQFFTDHGLEGWIVLGDVMGELGIFRTSGKYLP